MSNEALIQDICEVVSIVLRTKSSELDIKSSNETVSNWDSINHINLILALEEEFDIDIDDEDVSTLFSVKSIVSLIESKSSQ